MVADRLPEDPESSFFENIAEKIPENELDIIGSEVVDGFENDLDSLTELKNLRVEYNKLFDLKFERKNQPWENASNIKLPVITTACTNFQSRSSINLFTTPNPVQVFPMTGTESAKEKSLRIKKHMNWQINFKMPNFYDSFDKTLMSLSKDGYAFRKVFWDSIEKRVVSTNILPEDFVANYYTNDLETSYRYTQVLHLTENEIRIKGKQGIYINTEDVTEPTNEDSDSEGSQNKRNIGLNEPTPDYATPRQVLEVHTYLRVGKDEIRKPYVITIDRETRKVYRIINRANPETGRPIHYIVNYTFLPNPESIYGYGFGLFLLGANSAMNTALNQMTDAAHLGNVRGGWILKGSGMKRGDTSFKLGEYKEVALRTDDVRKAIFPMQFDPPSQVLMNLVSFLQNYVDRLTSVTEVFSGVTKSDTTATGQTIAVEQGSKVFTAIQQRIHRSFKKELQTIYNLNGIFLDEQEYVFVIQDEINSFEEAAISRSDYLDPVDVAPVSDPNIISEQQILSKAQALNQLIAQDPLLSNNLEARRLGTNQMMRALNFGSDLINSLNEIQEEQIKVQVEQAEAQRKALLEQQLAAKLQGQPLPVEIPQ